MDLGLRGKVALVTGASRGIGAAIAVELAREGCDVAITARSAEGLARTAEAIHATGRRASVHALDLTAEDAPQALFDRATGELGPFDAIICNAGATKRGDFLELTEQDWAAGYALKFSAHRRLLHAAWRQLAQQRGTAVFISGVGGRTPGAEFTLGGSVNAAVLSFAKALSEKGLMDGVRVNVVNPGAIETERLTTRIHALAMKRNIPEADARRELAIELGIPSFGAPEDVARTVAFLVSDASRHLRGTSIDIDGGQTKTW